MVNIETFYNFLCSGDWSRHFWPRDVRGMSAEPLLIYPTHYTGEEGYVTDTEDSDVVEKFLEEKDDFVEIDGKLVAKKDLPEFEGKDEL